MAEDVYCTLLMSDSYLPGVAVLAQSLRDCGTKKKLAVLVTIESLLYDTITQLKELFDYVIPVQKLANPNLENLYRLDRLDLRFSFTKIALWRQTQFRKIVYIDADAVALRAPDELFDLDVPFAAAPDIGWPDIFNSGVMLLSPSMSEYWSLHTLASSGTSFDGADQGLLNEYFSNRPWHRLSFTYNCTPNSGYQYEPAYRHFRSSINMVHFIGRDKPWTIGREHLSAAGSGVFKELLGRWWMVYDRHYRIFDSSGSKRLTNARVIQQYVKGEQAQIDFSWASSGAQTGDIATSSTPPPPPSIASPGPNTQPTQNPTPSQETPKPEEPPFHAPPMQWDATRSEPPPESAPEAKNLPTSRYEMSYDTGLFRPPPSYPEPPKDLYFQLPGTKPAVLEKPKPIFPWEERTRKPTRVFADDLPTEPEETTSQSSSQAESSSGFSTSQPSKYADMSSPSTPTTMIPPSDPWQSFSRTNAWDEIASIESYIRTVKQAQKRRTGQVQVLLQDPETAVQAITSPTSPTAKRRESLILTDFPTEIERPSLPVTPAPVHRQTFWGEERDSEGNLPAAQGVPEQVDWVCPRCGYVVPSQSSCQIPSQQISQELAQRSHRPSSFEFENEFDPQYRYKNTTANFAIPVKNPTERLEELRRASVIMTEELPRSEDRELPQREVPESSKSVGSPPISLQSQGLGLHFGPNQSRPEETAQPQPQQPSPTSLPNSNAITMASSTTNETSDTAPIGPNPAQSAQKDSNSMDEYSIA